MNFSGRIGFIGYYILTQVLAFIHLTHGIIMGESSIWSLTNLCTQLLFVKIYRTKKSASINSEPTIFLSNHRSWTDFTIDSAVLGGGSYLARFMVFVAVPFSVLSAWLTSSIWLFRRRPGIDRKWFVNFCKASLEQRPGSSVIVYPEGTRNTMSVPLKLKKGVLSVAWQLEMPVQATITTNKEVCINEKKLICNFGTKLVVHVSNSIHPKDFGTLSEWETACSDLFETAWNTAYEANEDSVHRIYTLPITNEKPTKEKVLFHKLIVARCVLILISALFMAMYIYYYIVLFRSEMTSPRTSATLLEL